MYGGASAADRQGHCEFAYQILNSVGEARLASCEQGIGLRPVHVLFRDCQNSGAFRDEDGPGGELAVARCMTGSMHVEAMWPLTGNGLIGPPGPPGPPGPTTTGGVWPVITLFNTLLILATVILGPLGQPLIAMVKGRKQVGATAFQSANDL